MAIRGCALRFRPKFHSVRHISQLRPAKNLGTLASHDDVPIIRASTGAQSAGSHIQKHERLDPLTIEARSPSPGMAISPEYLTKEISAMTLNLQPQDLRQQVSRLYKRLLNGEPHRPSFESIDVEAHIVGIFLQNYATLQSILLEVQKRLPASWSPKSILEVGYGPLPGLLLCRRLFDEYKPEREVGIVIGHPRMKRRAKQLLAAESSRKLEDETVIIRDEVPTERSPGRYDLIIATHQIYQAGQYSKEIADKHAKQLGSLLAPGGVLLIVERGDPLGFEAVARSKEILMRDGNSDVIAPCSHTKKCPLQMGLVTRQTARNAGSQNWCRFTQNVHRPRFATELKKGQYLSQPWDDSDVNSADYGRGSGGKSLAGKGRPGSNAHEIANYSYIAVQKNAHRNESTNSTEDESSRWPRVLKQPLKRDGHVILEVCASNGDIQHWTVPRSQGKQSYHDARKANKGDLWALDAKTKQSRGGLRPFAGVEKANDVRQPDTTSAAKSSKSVDWWSRSIPNPMHKREAEDPDLLESLQLIIDREDKLDAKDRQNVYEKF